MKKQYSIAYISAVIALPIALLFIVPGVAKTNAYQWYDSGAWSEDYTQNEAESDGEHEEDEDTSGADTADNVSNENDDEGSYDTGTHEQSSENEGDEWDNHDDDANTEDDDAYSNDRNDKEWGSYVWGTAHTYSYSHNHYDGCGHEDEDEDDCDDDCNDHQDDCGDDCDDHHDECDEECDDDYDWCDNHDCSEPEAPTCTLTADPSESWWSGDEVILNWDTEYADSVSITHIGDASLDGSEAVYVTETITYELTATGAGGTVTCSETVTVHEHEDESVSCDAFTASDLNINEGDSVELNWSTTGASSVAIDQGVGTVAVDGSTRVYLYKDTTFTLTARDGDIVDTCAIAVTVDEHNDTNEVSCDAFTVSDANISRGDEVTLQWNTSNADEVTIDQGVGTVVEDGTKKVTVNSDTTFTLTAKDGSKTDTCTVNVDVKSSGGGGGGSSSKKPQCEFTISDNAISTGQNVILSWVNKYADRMVLKEGTKTLVDTKKDKDVDEDKDDMTVSPDKSTTYTLEVYNGSKKNTCELSVEVGKKGKVEGISLSQVPYTGFDAGPMLTALFYGAIVLWGLVIGYVLVLKKKSRALSK